MRSRASELTVPSPVAIRFEALDRRAWLRAHEASSCEGEARDRLSAAGSISSAGRVQLQLRLPQEAASSASHAFKSQRAHRALTGEDRSDGGGARLRAHVGVTAAAMAEVAREVGRVVEAMAAVMEEVATEMATVKVAREVPKVEEVRVVDLLLCLKTLLSLRLDPSGDS